MESVDRFLPGFQQRRAASAPAHTGKRRDLEKNTFLKLPPKERNLVSRIKFTLEGSMNKDLRVGVLNIPSLTPRPQTEPKSMLPHMWPPEGYRSIGINDRVKSSHGRYSGYITDAAQCTCDRAFRSTQKNPLSIQFCDILGPYACADCTRKRKVTRLHDAVIPTEMDENSFTPLARLEREAAQHQKTLLDRRRRVATADTRKIRIESNEEADLEEEESDLVPELPTGFPSQSLEKRRGTVEMFRSLVKFTRYATSFSSYEGDLTKVGPPLALTGAYTETTG